MLTSDLSAAWRARAAELRRYAPAAAEAFEAAAEELAAALIEGEGELLTLAEASRESGYSERRLREKLSNGDLPQAGRKHAPRIRRGDLPRRQKKGPAASYDVAKDAAELLGRMAEQEREPNKAA